MTDRQPAYADEAPRERARADFTAPPRRAGAVRPKIGGRPREGAASSNRKRSAEGLRPHAPARASVKKNVPEIMIREDVDRGNARRNIWRRARSALQRVT